MKEQTNRLKTKEMEEVLNSWKQIPIEQLKENIQKIQKDIINEWIVERKRQEDIYTNLIDPMTIDGKVSCCACDYYLGELSWIRKRNNCYFVQQKEFFDRIEIERYSKPDIRHEIQINGKIRCGDKKCRQDLGGAQQYIDRPDVKEICALQCKQLKFSFNDEKGEHCIKTFKKWTNLPFKIRELEPFLSKNTVSA